MRGLSISAAWDETKAILARDGRLFASVALALVALPTALTTLLNPGGRTDSSTPLWMDVLMLVGSLVALAGQLALIRLALGPSITVGGAIGHGLRRMPVYLLAAILILAALLIAAIPFAIALVAAGVPLDRTAAIHLSGPVLIAVLLYLLLVLFIGVRMILTAPVASAEGAGAVAILKRSWQLTGAHFWPLLGFLLLFFLGAIIFLTAAAAASGVIVKLLLGSIEPLSASALLVGLVQALINAVITTVFTVMLARMYAQLSGHGEAQASVPSSGI